MTDTEPKRLTEMEVLRALTAAGVAAHEIGQAVERTSHAIEVV